MEREYIIGLDIGGTNVKCGIFTPEYSPKQVWEIQNYDTDSSMDSVDFLIKDLEIELEKLKIRKRSIRAIGLAIAANVTRDGRILGSTNLHINLSGMTEALSRHFDCPVKAANDADMAALGECYRGASRDAGSSVMFTLGTGVGSGIVSGKKSAVRSPRCSRRSRPHTYTGG
jgi:glucokinase